MSVLDLDDTNNLNLTDIDLISNMTNLWLTHVLLTHYEFIGFMKTNFRGIITDGKLPEDYMDWNLLCNHFTNNGKTICGFYNGDPDFTWDYIRYPDKMTDPMTGWVTGWATNRIVNVKYIIDWYNNHFNTANV